MKSLLLTDTESEKIASFLKEASNIPVVECVFAISFFDYRNKKERIEVVAIFNEEPEYNILLTGEKYRDTLDEIDRLDEVAIDCNEYGSSRLHFADSYDYFGFTTPGSLGEHLLKEHIINGTILFDRFGKVTEMKKELLENNHKVYTNILSIENIDSVLYGVKKLELK